MSKWKFKIQAGVSIAEENVIVFMQEGKPLSKKECEERCGEIDDYEAAIPLVEHDPDYDQGAYEKVNSIVFSIFDARTILNILEIYFNFDKYISENWR